VCSHFYLVIKVQSPCCVGPWSNVHSLVGSFYVAKVESFFFFFDKFLLANVNSAKEFHCVNSIGTYSVLCSLPTLLYSLNSPSSLLFSNSICWVSLCYLHNIRNSHIYISIHLILRSSSSPSTLSFLLPPPADSPQTVPILHSCPIIILASLSF
jgi:hypothetical protein